MTQADWLTAPGDDSSLLSRDWLLPARVGPWGRALALSARGVGQAILGVLLYLSIAVPLFALQWVATPLAPVLWVASLIQTALFFTFDAFYEPLHRRGYSFGQKWRFIGTHLA